MDQSQKPLRESETTSIGSSRNGTESAPYSDSVKNETREREAALADVSVRRIPYPRGRPGKAILPHPHVKKASDLHLLLRLILRLRQAGGVILPFTS